jgi:endonuclease YncB( thermonuclease family)
MLAFAIPAFGETVTAGLGEAVDGDTLVLNGRNLDIAGIVAPEPGFLCTLRGRTSDCGSIARGALLDLMAGAVVTCNSISGGWQCSAGGFDLAQNMVHTGWAVPVRDDDPRFSAQLARAMTRNQGLWHAVPQLSLGEIRSAGAH